MSDVLGKHKRLGRSRLSASNSGFNESKRNKFAQDFDYGRHRLSRNVKKLSTILPSCLTTMTRKGSEGHRLFKISQTIDWLRNLLQ